MMARLDQFFWDMKLRLAVWWRDHMAGRHIFDGFIWWLMFRKYKECRSFCPGCRCLDECRANVRARYQAEKK